uniref:PiggyBac transposable element-derived protein 4 C-terminal zinc-ribbon domain-containing protein n=1 Tax=Magallana gigas TaxID=29159 RepID=A0A8W8NRW1_MAGGI
MDGETTNHRLVLNPGNVKRNCVYCRQMGFRFACGNSKTSYYRCEEFGELHPNHPKDTVKRAVVASVVQTLPDGVIRCHNFEPGYSKKMCIVCRETVPTNVDAYPRGRHRQSKFEAIKEVTNENTLVYHQLVPHPGYMKKTCAYCRDHGIRFASGCPKTSYYRCDLCQVALCRPSVSDCFVNWHKDRKEGKFYIPPF